MTPDERFEVEERILEALAESPKLTKTQCAEAAGLNYMQLYSLLDNNPGFRQRFERMWRHAQEGAIDRVESAHYDNATLPTPRDPHGNVVAQIHILKHRRSTHYADKTVRGSGPVLNIGHAQILMAQGAEAEIRQIEGGKDDDSG